MTNPPLHVRGILIQMALVTSAQKLFAKSAEVATRRRCLLSQPGVSISDIHLVASAVMVPRPKLIPKLRCLVEAPTYATPSTSANHPLWKAKHVKRRGELTRQDLANGAQFGIAGRQQ